MRFIPKRTKIKMEILNNLTFIDVLVAFFFLATSVLIATTDFWEGSNNEIFIALAWLSVGIVSLIPMKDGVRTYKSLVIIFRFFAFRKHYKKGASLDKKSKATDMSEIIPYVSIDSDMYINFKDYYAMAFEVRPLEFGLLSEEKQNGMINALANAMRRLSANQKGNIVKINKAMVLDEYIRYEDSKYDAVLKMQEENQMSEAEVTARAPVFEGRVEHLSELNTESKIYKDHFYVVVYDKDKNSLSDTIEGMINDLRRSVTPLHCRQCMGKDLAVFLRSCYSKDFDERELDLIPREEYCEWATPDEIKFKVNSVNVDGQDFANFLITDYPLYVGNAWGFPFFSQDRTRVVVSFSPMDKMKAERQIDNAIIEMELKLNKSLKSSKTIDVQTHLETLRELLKDLKNSNEALFNVNTFITCEAPVRKEMRAVLKQNGFRYAELFGRQVDAFVSANISMLDTFEQNQRGIHTTSLAAIFPFISSALQDRMGFYLGSNEYPVFVDFFQRNDERVNSNMMIIGKSGSGKSFATKTLLTNLASDNARIFILDPEDEYTNLSRNLGGKMIDVGSSQNGILNPFHVMTNLRDDDDEDYVDDSFQQHLQFLEQFFKIIFEGMESDPFELLNTLCVEVYKRKGIDRTTNLENKKPEDYPIFDDFMELVREKLKDATEDYYRRNLMVIETYLQKFATGGRNSNLWNGPTSIETSENFVTFNFRSILANRNDVVANAQMLLVFKYLDNEIIRNKDFNDNNMGSDPYKRRKIIVAVDEAHVFINPKHPIALDFMANMAKRIRKYDGMQIIITQNIKDFVGTPEIQRQSTAVINACQYSAIFSLSPADITDLVELYRNAGQINETEQDSIVTAGRGQCFLITSPLFRTSLYIDPLPIVRYIFDPKHL